MAQSIYGKIGQAAEGMRDAMNFNIQDPELDLKMVELLEKKKELDQAMDQFCKTLSLQPGFTSLDRDHIAIVFDIKKKYEAKLAQFHEIKDKDYEN